MKVNVNTVLKDYAGNPLKTGSAENAEEITIGKLLLQVASVNPPPGKTYPPNDQVMRWYLGATAWSAQETPPHEMHLSKKTVGIIAEDISRLWGPMVAGQFLSMLGMKPAPEEEDTP